MNALIENGKKARLGVNSLMIPVPKGVTVTTDAKTLTGRLFTNGIALGQIKTALQQQFRTERPERKQVILLKGISENGVMLAQKMLKMGFGPTTPELIDFIAEFCEQFPAGAEISIENADVATARMMPVDVVWGKRFGLMAEIYYLVQDTLGRAWVMTPDGKYAILAPGQVTECFRDENGELIDEDRLALFRREDLVNYTAGKQVQPNFPSFLGESSMAVAA